MDDTLMSDSRTNRTRKQARHLKEAARQYPPTPTEQVEQILWPDAWLTADDRKGWK